jgi:hypothetical protein
VLALVAALLAGVGSAAAASEPGSARDAPQPHQAQSPRRGAPDGGAEVRDAGEVAPQPPPPPDPDADVIEHLDELERLELLDNLELFDGSDAGR